MLFKIAELNKIRIKQLQAGLGFLVGINFQEAQTRYKGGRIDQLKDQIIVIYNNSIPRECGDYKFIFNNDHLPTD